MRYRVTYIDYTGYIGEREINDVVSESELRNLERRESSGYIRITYTQVI